jgi:hypothetical protein
MNKAAFLPLSTDTPSQPLELISPAASPVIHRKGLI